MEALMALSPIRKLILAIATALFFVAIGATSAEMFEHRPAGKIAILGTSLSAQRDAASINVFFWRGRATYWMDAYNAWHGAAQRCEDKRRDEALKAADHVTDASKVRSVANDDAFNAGFAAGKVAGRRTCGAPNATTSPSVSPGAGADGVRDHQAPGTGGDPVFGSRAYRAGG